VTTTHAVEDDVARLLREMRAGEPAAEDALFSLLYEELRGMAARRFLTERKDHTLVPTSLVHEVYIRLDLARLTCADRDEFLRLAGTVMRRVLIDSARRRRSRRPVEHDAAADRSAEPDEAAALALDGALTRLEQTDPELSRLVNLRFLVGLSVAETAEVLGVSTATIVRGWRTARAFLQREVERDD